MDRHIVSIAALLETEPGIPFAETRAGRLLGDFYERIYRPAFPDMAEREELADWRQTLSKASGYELHPELLLDGEDRVVAGLLWEYYPRSNSVLATYVATDPQLRTSGCAAQLMGAMGANTREQARARSCAAPIVYAETRDPAITEAEMRDGDVRRLRILDRLGFRLLDVRYLQPPLEPDGPYCDHLAFLCYAASVPVQGVTGAALGAFLDEFFDVLASRTGAQRTQEWLAARRSLDADAVLMTRSLEDYARHFAAAGSAGGKP